MVRGKKWVDFTLDEGQSGITLGYIAGISDNVSTREYAESAATYAAGRLSREFEVAMDTVAAASPENFYHVYNWSDEYGEYTNVGNPTRRLWKLVNMGSGRGRTVGFTFLPETVPSPIEPGLLEPGPSGQTVNTEVHVFTWKATVMEYGLEVEIRPKLPGVKAMAFWDDEEEKIVFRRDPIITIPGYRTTTGRFTGFWLKWWGEVAPDEYMAKVRPELERDVITDRELTKVSRRATRRRRKDIGFGATDFRTGYQLAMKHMEDNKMNYIRNARRRRLEKYGY